ARHRLRRRERHQGGGAVDGRRQELEPDEARQGSRQVRVPAVAGDGQAGGGRQRAHGAGDQHDRRGGAGGGALGTGRLHAQRRRDGQREGGVTMRKLLLLSALLVAGAAIAKPAKYALPPETSTLKKTDEPGYAKTEALCTACHSRDYITTQPRGKGKDFWTA